MHAHERSNGLPPQESLDRPPLSTGLKQGFTGFFSIIMWNSPRVQLMYHRFSPCESLNSWRRHTLLSSPI
ncbi:rCG52145 [Rattus norvegicus]|uniref:RCG52145 n=1 Tax=Rattus norvegicus TaxID=10116 RepID=A6K6H5_RAT|nr:rCG52145 [Rattus norvegicus]